MKNLTQVQGGEMVVSRVFLPDREQEQRLLGGFEAGGASALVGGEW